MKDLKNLEGSLCSEKAMGVDKDDSELQETLKMM